MKKAAVLLPGIAVALIATGCGNGQGSASMRPSGQASSQPASAGTRLTVTVRPSDTGKATTHTLTCDPTGGDLSRANEACAALDKAAAAKKDPFAPTPPHQMCTQIYGGPQVATVTGTWNGEKVDATFNRKNGCEIARWNHLSSLLGQTGSTG